MDPLLRLDSTGGVLKLKGIDALSQSIRNILSTMKFSRVRTQIGSDLFKIIHKPVNTETAEEVKRIISSAISQYDNRIKSLRVDVTPFTKENYFEVSIKFQEDGSLSYEEIITFLDGRISE
jgi:phage baseplate assembly protein W